MGGIFLMIWVQDVGEKPFTGFGLRKALSVRGSDS